MGLSESKKGTLRDSTSERNPICCIASKLVRLLKFDRSTSFFDFFFHLFGFLFTHTFLKGGGNPFDHLLGFHEGGAGQVFDHFDDFELLVAESGHDNVELGLFFSSFTATATTGGHYNGSTTSSGLNAVLF